MPNFSSRSTEMEIMDDYTHPPEIINKVLDELDSINALLGGYAVTFNALKKINLKSGDTISDWGCGGADSIRKIASWANERNLHFNYVGIDAAENIIEYAKLKCIHINNLHFICANVFDESIKENQFEIVTSTLFTHHFEDKDWVKLIKKMHFSSKKAVVINDLHRHWFAYYSIKFLTKLFSKSSMVIHDGPLSVLRAFTRKELENLLDQAELKNYTIKWAWAFRWQIIIYK